MDASFYFQSIMLGIGLAMDSFSVSIADSLAEPGMSKRKGAGVAAMFGGCQMLFPLIGWFLVHTLLELFGILESIIPWAALILLSYIGHDMIKEGIAIEEDTDTSQKVLSFPQLVLQGIATAIDALSVGLAISEYDLTEAFICSLIIGVVTFFISLSGLLIGKKLGDLVGKRASILGGCILIFIGIKVLIDHFQG